MTKVASTALLLLLCLYGSAQVNISSVNYNTVSLNESNCLQAIESNSASPVMAFATVTVKNSGGEMILVAKTRNFTLNAGINTVTGATVGFSSFTYGNTGKALYLKTNGMLPSGGYTYCLNIAITGTEVSGDVYCEEFEAATDDFLSLVSPYDKEILETKLPVLTWTHSEPFNTLAKNEYFKLVLTEIRKDQSADQAVFSNPVVYSKTFLTSHSIPYPMDAKELEDGKIYAWQVQKISNNIIVNKTDVWQFSLKKKINKGDLKYAVLKRQYDAGYYTAQNERIFFQFEEPYAGTDLKYTIYNTKRKEVKAGLHNEHNAKTSQKANFMKETGINQYELDLSAYSLKSGYYFLEVQDEKNKTSVLKFYVE